jgi:Kef-type K+ transport system membrane component KefB
MALRFVIQIGALLLTAKVLGGFAERLKYPSVVGEIIAGILLGPYLFGSSIVIPKIGPLFAVPAEGSLPIEDTIWAVAQLGIILLLFLAGVETDPSLFLRYGAKGALIAVGGVVLPFILGDWATVAFGYADSFIFYSPINPRIGL